MDHAAEWLEADGLGGFASGTVGGVRTRRYHALLLASTTPPTGRYVLVNGCEAWIERDGQRFPVSAQYYTPDVTGSSSVPSSPAATITPCITRIQASSSTRSATATP